MKKRIAALIFMCIFFQTAARADTSRINGVDLHYETKGVGDPLLLIHGFGSCAAEWGSLTDAFAKQYRVIAIDMRGHGQSTNPTKEFTHRQSAEDVRALLDHLAIPKARAVGFSSGGMTLLHFATKYPDRLSKLVLVSATTHFPKEARAILRGASTETMPPPVLEQYARCATRGQLQVKELVAQFRAFGDMKDDMNLGAADLGRIKASTLIVHGDRDMFFPVAIPVAMYAGIAKSSLWIVPNGNHEPNAGADEADFVRTVSAFMKQ